ncbi:MAG: hypothetical protein KAW17_01725 [Candidatus Eisenbacteria sp.]|nr:hypothetical protein [Candidatus Eisenbacteria bacterium]
MRRTKIYKYFAFGYNYHLLRFYNEDTPVHGRGDTLLSRVDEFVDNLDDLNLKVTRQAAKKLLRIRADARRLPKDAKVDSALAQRVSEAVEALDATLDAELQLRTAYVVTPKRFDIVHLVDSPAELLGKKTYNELSPICQADFSDACRCVAFGVPTGAAFYLMRCVEGVLRSYYCRVVRRGRLKTMLWKGMIDHLRKRRDSPPKEMLDALDNLRYNYRNPTQHPDKRFDIDEAQDLLAATIDAINRMVRDMIQR